MKLKLNLILLCCSVIYLSCILANDSSSEGASSDSDSDGSYPFPEKDFREIMNDINSLRLYERIPTIWGYLKPIRTSKVRTIVTFLDDFCSIATFNAKLMNEPYNGQAVTVLFVAHTNHGYGHNRKRGMPCDFYKTINAFQNPSVEEYGIANMIRYELLPNNYSLIMYTKADIVFAYHDWFNSDPESGYIINRWRHLDDVKLLLALKYYVKATKYVNGCGFLTGFNEITYILFKGSRVLYAGLEQFERIVVEDVTPYARFQWAKFIDMLGLRDNTVEWYDVKFIDDLYGNIRQLISIETHPLAIYSQRKINESIKNYRLEVKLRKKSIRNIFQARQRSEIVTRVFDQFIDEILVGMFENGSIKHRMFPDYDKIYRMAKDAIQQIYNEDYDIQKIVHPYESNIKKTEKREASADPHSSSA